MSNHHTRITNHTQNINPPKPRHNKQSTSHHNWSTAHPSLSSFPNLFNKIHTRCRMFINRCISYLITCGIRSTVVSIINRVIQIVWIRHWMRTRLISIWFRLGMNLISMISLGRVRWRKRRGFMGWSMVSIKGKWVEGKVNSKLG